MKIISKILKLSMIFILTASIFSCSNDDDNSMTEPNIVETALATSNLSSLVAALQAADGDLVTLLSGEGPFTVLAPTNEAFSAFLSAKGYASLEAVPTDFLAQILKNHVISADIKSTDLVTAGAGYASTNATNSDGDYLSVYFDTSSGVRFNNVASVTTGGADIEASNGTVHLVDAVIDLPTVVTFATSNPALSNLVAALSSADSQDPSPMLIPTLSTGSAQFTVFAPTNQAFADLLLELDPSGNTTLGDIPPSTVEAVLLYHVVSGANVRSTDLTTGTVTTIGGDISANTSNFTLTDANGRTSNIVTTLVDIQAVNGVVHVIDKVILPPQE